MRRRRYILFLIIAILTFLIGIAAGTIFNFSSSEEVKRTPCGSAQTRLEPLPSSPLAMPATPAAPSRSGVVTSVEVRTAEDNKDNTSKAKSKSKASIEVVRRGS
jgi:flagellar basal body-associated protein FliL